MDTTGQGIDRATQAVDAALNHLGPPATETTTRYFLSDEYGSDQHGRLTALVAEQTGNGTYTRVIAFKADLDKIHPVLWPTLLAQYSGLARHAAGGAS